MNTAVVVIIVNYDWEESWFVPGGLAVDMFYIILANAFFQPVFYFFNPWHVIKKIRQKRAEKNEYLNQGDANMLFEGPPVDMAQRYATVMKTFIVTLVYAPLLPAGLLISFMGVTIEYFVDKYLLLRRHSRPNRLSSDLANVMTTMIPWAIFFYSVMNFVFNDVLESDGAFPA
jgi:hypothetical protein